MQQNVRETSDYGRFKMILGNRLLKENNVRNVMHQIAQRGQTVPIVVNERYEIIDGQHRLESCRRLKKPVKYVIKRGLNIDDVISSNIVGAKWGLQDFVRRYAIQGNKDYVKLQKFIDECKAHKISASCAVLIARAGKSDDTMYMCDDGKLHKHGSKMKVKKLYCVGSEVKIGLFKMIDEPGAYKRLEAVVKFKEYKFFSKGGFINALIQVMRIKDFSLDRLLKNAKQYPSRFTNEPGVDAFVTMFESVYNYRTTPKLPLVNHPERRK